MPDFPKQQKTRHPIHLLKNDETNQYQQLVGRHLDLHDALVYSHRLADEVVQLHHLSAPNEEVHIPRDDFSTFKRVVDIKALRFC